MTTDVLLFAYLCNVFDESLALLTHCRRYGRHLHAGMYVVLL